MNNLKSTLFPSNSAKQIIRQRQVGVGIVLLCAALLATGYYLEHALGLLPCPLCITQRLCFYLCAVLAASAALLTASRPNSARWLWFGGVAAALLGLWTAGRQLWLQSLPPDLIPSCGPSLSYVLEALPLSEGFRAMFYGDGNCAEVQWQFAGLSIPAWAAQSFIAISLACAYSIVLTNFLGDDGAANKR